MNTSERNGNKYISAADTAAESGASAVDNALLTRSANIVHANHNSSISNSTALHQVHLSPTDSTSIDMEYEPNIESRRDTVSTSSPSSSSSSVQRNFLTLFSGARIQLGRNTSLPLMHQQPNSTSSSPLYAHTDEHEATRPFHYTSHENAQTQHTPLFSTASAASQSPTHARNIRSWRMNLNNVLSFSTAPSTEAIRSLITNSGSFRYAPLNTNDVAATATATDNVHVLLQQQEQQQRARPHASEHSTYLGSNYAETSSRNSFNNTLRSEDARDSMEYNRNGNMLHAAVGGADTAVNVPQVDEAAVDAHFAHRNDGNRNTNTQQDDEDNNVISDMFVKFLSHFVRYLPFLIILFVKFVHDHLLGILDLLLLHGIMYQVNKSLREQIAKFSQKSYGILLRDFGLVGFVVAYRFVLSSSAPDPFGLLIAPPTVGITLPLATEGISSETKNKLSAVLSNYLGNINIMQNTKTDASTEAAAASLDSSTVNITKVISLGVLLYYVAVNDLILKLITILLKISITLMPTNIIRHKPRARMYVLVEYFSQFYRAMAPVRQWLMFLFESYSGLEVISGILFSSFYMGAKGFEFVERGKSLKKALLNFIRNMDYERKPTKDELEAAGAVCPICHDAYSTPVVLECGHIFCDDCVSTWFKREQTCPMCRAKVSEDPTWQDGSTTFFYQLW